MNAIKIIALLNFCISIGLAIYTNLANREEKELRERVEELEKKLQDKQQNE